MQQIVFFMAEITGLPKLIHKRRVFEHLRLARNAANSLLIVTTSRI